MTAATAKKAQAAASERAEVRLLAPLGQHQLHLHIDLKEAAASHELSCSGFGSPYSQLLQTVLEISECALNTTLASTTINLHVFLSKMGVTKVQTLIFKAVAKNQQNLFKT